MALDVCLHNAFA
ncbi:hypothetical protein VLH64_003263 [Vibrio cholerae]|nr:hypothetical protein [Vibrio cholerae]